MAPTQVAAKASSPAYKKSSIKAESESIPAIKTDEKSLRNGDKDATFALPNKPGQTAGEAKEGKGDAHFSKEPNPFENAFGAPSDTPGKTQLPGVTSLTSPAPLLGGMTPGWAGSLRSGPLSPAMLTGPTNNDYFSHEPNFAGSFPTPNESSLRTGLTPGAFPQPSPSSQAIFNAMQNGGATPGTIDFHRTAMHARAATGSTSAAATGENGSAPTASAAGTDRNIQPGLDNSASFPTPAQRENLEQHDTDAANGLFMLAQARGNKPEQTQYPAPGQQAPPMPYIANSQTQGNASDPARRAGKNSIASNVSGESGGEGDDIAENGQDSAQKSGGKKGSRSKKGSAGKNGNARRKAEDTPVKMNVKKQKVNSGTAFSMDDFGDGEEDKEEPEQTHHPDGRKLTDEEKRKNFLERNRIAALKCRQRKKQWLANLQQKVELFSTENDALAATVTSLREEVVTLKSLLLAHKDCPIAHAQGIGGMAMQSIAGDAQQYGAHPYAMAMSQSMHQHGMNQNMQRR